MRPTIYLAGASAELSRAQRWAIALERTQMVELTSHWFQCTDLGQDVYLARDQQATIAEDCLTAIARARIVWFLFPRSMAGGSMVEFGAALAFSSMHPSRKTVVTGQGCSRTVFTGPRSLIRDESDSVDFTEVCRLARELS